MGSQRFASPDLLKGLAVIFMIQVHLMELFATPEVYGSWMGRLSLFLGGPSAAPVFMAVMGYFLAQTKKPTSYFLLRASKLIGLAFLLNLGLNAHLLLKIANGTLAINPFPYIFGVDILFLAGISIILTALFKPLFKGYWLPWLILMLLFAGLNPYLPIYSGSLTWVKYVQAYFWGYTSWSYFPVFPWMAYVMAGYVFYLIIKKLPAIIFSFKIRLLLVIILTVFLALSYNYGLRIASILEVYYHHSILFFLWDLAFLAWWVLLIDEISTYFSRILPFRYLQWIGKNVTVFYVVQWLIIGNIATAIYQTQAIDTLPFWFIGILAMTSVFVVAYNRVQGLKSKAFQDS